MQQQEQEFSFKDLFVPFTTLKAISWIIFIGVVVYANSLFNGFISDDYAQVVDNVAIHSLKNIGEFFINSTFNNGSIGLTGMYYKPILTTLYALIYSVFQNWAFPYHLLQLFMHITNSILLLLILKKYLKREIAFAISLIFLIHPINNEAVVYVASLQEPLFLFFCLLSLLIIQEVTESRIKHVLVTVLLLFSLLSKETGIVFIVMLPLFLKLFKNKWVPAIYESSVALGIYLILRLGVAHIFLNHTQIFKYSLTQMNVLQRLVNIPAVLFFYIQTFFYPKNLLVFQRWVVTSINFQNFYLPLIIDLFFIGSLMVCGYWIYKKHHEQFKLYFFFFLWFILGIFLHLQIISLDFTVADRWFYFPIIGLLGMIGIFVTIISHKSKHYAWLYIPLMVIIVIIFSVRDIVRNGNWVNAAVLYKHDIEMEPNNYELQSGLGIELYNQGQLKDAKAHLLYSIQLYPTTQNWAALGLVYEKLHDIPDAKRALLNALSYKNDPFSYQSLIKIMLVYDSPEDTASFIKTQLKSTPNDPFLWLYLSVEDYKLGKRDKALSEVQKSFSMYPSQESQYVYQKISNNEPIKVINNE